MTTRKCIAQLQKAAITLDDLRANRKFGQSPLSIAQFKALDRMVGDLYTMVERLRLDENVRQSVN